MPCEERIFHVETETYSIPSHNSAYDNACGRSTPAVGIAGGLCGIVPSPESTVSLNDLPLSPIPAAVCSTGISNPTAHLPTSNSSPASLSFNASCTPAAKPLSPYPPDPESPSSEVESAISMREARCLAQWLQIGVQTVQLKHNMRKFRVRFRSLTALLDAAKPQDDVESGCDWLLKSLMSLALQTEAAARRSAAFPPSSGAGWRLCAQLRHYQQLPGPRGAGMSHVSVLRFSDRQLEPQDPAVAEDMRQEANRVATFAEVPMAQARSLAAAGWYLEEPGRLRCAFCHGRVDLAEAVDAIVQVAEQNDNGAARLHRERFATCPMVLGLDVGNSPTPLTEAGAPLKAPTACTEATEDGSGWRADTADLTTCPEAEAARQLRLRPTPPVSPGVARTACAPSAELNLSMMERSLPSRLEAAASLHPMRHSAMADPDRRVASLTAAAEAAAFAVATAAVADSKSSPPQQQPIPADLLAAAGFFADTAASAAVTCHWCGVRIAAWLPGDDPWVEHARWSPRCCHLLRERGADFVTAARRLHPPFHIEGAEADEAAKAAEAPRNSWQASATLVDFRVDPRQLRAREDAPEAALARRLLGQVAADDLRTALAERLRSAGDDFASGPQLLGAALDVCRRRLSGGLSAAEFHAARAAELELRRRVEAQRFEGDELDWRACKVCMDRLINVSLIGCGHFCCCSNCAANLDTCPLCRTHIRGTLLIRDSD